MKAKIFGAVLFVQSVCVSFGQTPELNKVFKPGEVQKSNDIAGALEVGKVYSVRLKSSPLGPGLKNEVGGGNHYFPQETHVSWIHFTAIKTGNLSIVIIPDTSRDDYDFLLFKDDGKGINQILSRVIQPVRSNCARTQGVGDGRTGLTYSLEGHEHIGAGRGEPFASAISVVKDEKYYLVINNVYDHGQGALIRFDYFEQKEISGVVSKENGQTLEAIITWEDRETGDTLAQTTSDPTSGEFSLSVPYRLNSTEGYDLVSTSSNGAFSETHYSAVEIHQCSPEPLSLVLPELKKGKRIRMGSINFQGGRPLFVTSAYPSLKRLHKLMKANPSLKIHIEGHTNGCDGDMKLLSEERAQAVMDFLVEKGIHVARMATEGLDCRYMLFPQHSTNNWRNRRVEILVTYY